MLADTTTENTEFLQNLADKVEDFAVQLLDQVHTKEEASIYDGGADRYGSLFSEMTKKAIIYGQKKVYFADNFHRKPESYLRTSSKPPSYICLYRHGVQC